MVVAGPEVAQRDGLELPVAEVVGDGEGLAV
jgi:hypothetical protein